MKKYTKFFLTILIVMLGLAMSACSKANEPTATKPANINTATTAAMPAKNNAAPASNTAEQQIDQKTERKIVIRKGDKQLVVKLGQGSAAKDLYSRLPLKVKLEDFNNTEKIAYLNSALKLDGEPKGYTPHTGDLAYYAPWKNLSVFYKEFRYSDNLIYLGKIETNSVMLEDFEGDDIVIEKAK